MKEVNPIYFEDEDYSKVYNDIDYKDKVVLEIGADIGSTACFYLANEAKRVISVEGNKAYFDELVKNIGDDSRVVPLHIFIENSSQIASLISEYNPDILHMDCESWEFLLFEVPIDLLKTIEQFDIEVHWDERMHKDLIERFLKNGYWVKDSLYVTRSVPLDGIRLFPNMIMTDKAWILKARKSIYNITPIAFRRILNGEMALKEIESRQCV